MQTAVDLSELRSERGHRRLRSASSTRPARVGACVPRISRRRRWRWRPRSELSTRRDDATGPTRRAEDLAQSEIVQAIVLAPDVHFGRQQAALPVRCSRVVFLLSLQCSRPS